MRTGCLGIFSSPRHPAIVLYCQSTQYLTGVFQERSTITVLPGQGCARIGSAIPRQGLSSRFDIVVLVVTEDEIVEFDR